MSSSTPNWCFRSCPNRSISNSVGVPCMPQAAMVFGIVPSSDGASIATGIEILYSCKNARTASCVPCALWCSKTVCSPSTHTSFELQVLATRIACGKPCETQPGQSIWNASIRATRPRKLAHVIEHEVLNQCTVCSSGALRSCAVRSFVIPLALCARAETNPLMRRHVLWLRKAVALPSFRLLAIPR
jgi:hypothetical protein